MIEITELKSSGENSENDQITLKTEEGIEWYEHFPGFRNLLNFETNSNWNRIVLKLDITDDTITIVKALGKCKADYSNILHSWI